uniref:Homeobox domain-containing protein n=1 Tax=Timema genevievae TaxID=629358 RepID=A0A7R9JWZ5_TIMGE|nr:unnamed protein product [Timema genevievae]
MLLSVLANGSFQPGMEPKRQRTAYTRHQILELEKEFHYNRMKWKKDNKLPNTKNVRRKTNPAGVTTTNPSGASKSSKSSRSKSNNNNERRRNSGNGGGGPNVDPCGTPVHQQQNHPHHLSQHHLTVLPQPPINRSPPDLLEHPVTLSNNGLHGLSAPTTHVLSQLTPLTPTPQTCGPTISAAAIKSDYGLTLTTL